MGKNAIRLVSYLEGVEHFHQAGVLGRAVLLEVIIFLPRVLGRALPVRQDAVLNPAQAPGAIGVRQVLPGCGQNPARTVGSMAPQLLVRKCLLEAFRLLLPPPRIPKAGGLRAIL